MPHGFELFCELDEMDGGTVGLLPRNAAGFAPALAFRKAGGSFTVAKDEFIGRHGGTIGFISPSLASASASFSAEISVRPPRAALGSEGCLTSRALHALFLPYSQQHSPEQ
jgi:hypothetical protein